MVRKVVITEGVLIPGNRIITPGALEPKNDVRLVVTVGYDVDQIMGWATDFERNEETGELSFDIQLKDGLPDDLLDDFDLSVYVMSLKLSLDYETNITTVQDGLIVSVVLIAPFGNPKL